MHARGRQSAEWLGEQARIAAHGKSEYPPQSAEAPAQRARPHLPRCCAFVKTAPVSVYGVGQKAQKARLPPAAVRGA